MNDANVALRSPYTRATYRYTPLLAALLAPNEWLHPSFGKFLFAGADILAGVLMYKLLVSVILPSPPHHSSCDGAGCRVTEVEKGKAIQQATLLVSLHLMIPLVFTISTRGSSESVLSLFVLSTLYYALKGQWDIAAILLGLSTHWKIYPFIYGVACLGVIGSQHGEAHGWKGWLQSVMNMRSVRFAVISGTTFVVLGATMYAM